LELHTLAARSYALLVLQAIKNWSRGRPGNEAKKNPSLQGFNFSYDITIKEKQKIATVLVFKETGASMATLVNNEIHL